MAEPVAIPYMHHPPMMATQQGYSQSYQDYYFPDSSSQSPEDYMHVDHNGYATQNQGNYTYTSSAYGQQSYSANEGSSTHQPPSPKLRRGYSMSGGGSGTVVIDSSKATPPSPTASSDKTFKQILAAIARVQTNLSQQYFTMMEMAEKQSAIQDKLSFLEQSYNRTDQGVSRLIDCTECMSDDVKDVRDRIDSDFSSLNMDHDFAQDVIGKQTDSFNKIFEEFSKIGLSVNSIEAGYKADRRGVTETPDTSEKSTNVLMDEMKLAFSTEVKEAVKIQVRTEIKSLKHSMMSELKDIRKMVKEDRDTSPDFSPEELLAFDDSKVTKYLEKYGFDSSWINELDVAQKKSLLGCYCGGTYRNALNRNNSNKFKVPCSFPV